MSVDIDNSIMKNVSSDIVRSICDNVNMGKDLGVGDIVYNAVYTDASKFLIDDIRNPLLIVLNGKVK